ncbi:SH3 domain-containing protein [Colletotrichum scovillei]|nr:SH3 domain-containing protein [Colletotrichum scovillei]KAG7066908.1 SH3 domain-containing protein [Colletotrichum scovillei]
MAVDVEELILAPFREVVERGEESAKNAHDAQDDDPETSREMAKSASMIAKEGQRALKRLQPLWNSQFEKHGDVFKDTIAENDDLAEKRRALEELLYDFEDYIELDTFDSAKFTDIQAATRSFALVVLDAIQRVKIDVKTSTTPVHKFPPLPPLPPLPPQLAQSLSASPQIRPGPPLRGGSHGATNTSSFPAVPRQPKPSASRSRTRGSHGSSDSATVRRAHSIAESTDSDPASSREFSGAASSSREDRRPSSPSLLSDGMGKLRIVTSPEPLQPRTSDWVEEQTSVPKARRPFRGSIPENSAVGDDAFNDGTFVTRIHRRGFDTVTPQSSTSTQHLRSISTVEKEEGCLIGPKSSFHQLKGFCDGAQTFRRGGYWHGIKQTMTWGEPLPIGRCMDCEYHHLNRSLTLDKEGDSRANFLKYGILYRVRLLVKSHIAVKTTAEIRYACLFCTHIGRTVHEGDATVFQSADQLLQHLSRHPQPLPEVPGVTVLYGQVDKDHHQIEDYDVHFPSPPAPNAFPDNDILTQFPVATALKSHVQRRGENLLGPDGSSNVLTFFLGAKIVGVEFPEQWGGKWCTGWHDGIQGPFPAKYVEIESPKQNEISFQATSAVSITTRWRWDPPDNSRAGWLTFGKGEVIRNVGWLYQDHWCWSGTNSKGKFGIFPQSHISPQSLKEGYLPPILKRTQPSGPMRLFSRRRKSTSTASSMSGDT